MPEEVFSVSELTADIRESLEDQFHEIWVEGEISNHRLPGSGHHYFTLKDHSAQLSCVLFKGAAKKNPVALRDGMQVQVLGNVSVYEARGQYQLIARTVQAKGAGDLQARFEELKRRLSDEGLFAAAQKQPLPVFPKRIAIVTSPTGAAVQDMLNVFARRAPWLEILISPVRVQGEGAADEISDAIRSLDAMESQIRPDLVIVARGGGSIEDLWSFNEEIVARAIAACSIPVLSGVGHEIDFTIADFVADRREPTPSAAAENATPDRADLIRHLDRLIEALENRSLSRISSLGRETAALQREIIAREPERRLQSFAQSLDYFSERLEATVDMNLRDARTDLASLDQVISSIHPQRLIEQSREQISRGMQSMDRQVDAHGKSLKEKTGNLLGLLRSFSPLAVLERGYSMTTDAEGSLVTSIDQIAKGELIQTRFADGIAKSAISEVSSTEN